jgi:hypothetical protein
MSGWATPHRGQKAPPAYVPLQAGHIFIIGAHPTTKVECEPESWEKAEREAAAGRGCPVSPRLRRMIGA